MKHSSHILNDAAGSARRELRVSTAAEQSFDLKGILEESLKAPMKSSKAAAPGPSPPPVPAPIPEPPSQPPQVHVLLLSGYLVLQAGRRGGFVKPDTSQQARRSTEICSARPHTCSHCAVRSACMQGCKDDMLVQIPQTQTLAPMSGAGSSVEEAIRSTSTVDAAPVAPPSQAAAEMTGALWQPAPCCSAALRTAVMAG